MSNDAYASNTYITDRPFVGTVLGVAHGGEYLALDVGGQPLFLDPKVARADRLGLAVGEAISVTNYRFDDPEQGVVKVEALQISRANGTAVLGAGGAIDPITGLPAGFPGTGLPYGDRDGEWFDRSGYERENDDVVAAGVDPLLHYLNNGALEGRDSETFDENYYLSLYPDLAAAKQVGAIASGWEHFTNIGAREGRQPAPGVAPAAVAAMADSFDRWRGYANI